MNSRHIWWWCGWIGENVRSDNRILIFDWYLFTGWDPARWKPNKKKRAFTHTSMWFIVFGNKMRRPHFGCKSYVFTQHFNFRQTKIYRILNCFRTITSCTISIRRREWTKKKRMKQWTNAPSKWKIVGENGKCIQYTHWLYHRVERIIVLKEFDPLLNP